MDANEAKNALESIRSDRFPEEQRRQEALALTATGVLPGTGQLASEVREELHAALRAERREREEGERGLEMRVMGGLDQRLQQVYQDTSHASEAANHSLVTTVEEKIAAVRQEAERRDEEWQRWGRGVGDACEATRGEVGRAEANLQAKLDGQSDAIAKDMAALRAELGAVERDWKILAEELNHVKLGHNPEMLELKVPFPCFSCARSVLRSDHVGVCDVRKTLRSSGKSPSQARRNRVSV